MAEGPSTCATESFARGSDGWYFPETSRRPRTPQPTPAARRGQPIEHERRDGSNGPVVEVGKRDVGPTGGDFHPWLQEMHDLGRGGGQADVAALSPTGAGGRRHEADFIFQVVGIAVIAVEHQQHLASRRALLKHGDQAGLHSLGISEHGNDDREACHDRLPLRRAVATIEAVRRRRDVSR